MSKVISVARLLCGASVLLLTPVGAASAQGARPAERSPAIVLPGAPGQAPRVLTPQEAVRVAGTRYSRDDVNFMRAMLPHHAQAAEMAALVEGRTNRREIVDVAGCIRASQDDEINIMQTLMGQSG